jgi:SNF2 family DNA or RNA helicase
LETELRPRQPQPRRKQRRHRRNLTAVFVHKLVCRGSIEDRILELQKQKSALVEALLSEGTTKLRIDAETLSHLLSPLA